MSSREAEFRHVTASEGIAYNTLRQLIRWDPSMALGDPLIDSEHEKIIEMAEQVCVLARDHDKSPDLVSAFSNFGELLFKHFDDEEKKLTKLHADGLSKHIAQHQAMRSEFEFIRQRLMDDGIGWACEEQSLVVVNFMIGVTVGHVLESDAHQTLSQ